MTRRELLTALPAVCAAVVGASVTPPASRERGGESSEHQQVVITTTLDSKAIARQVMRDLQKMIARQGLING